MSTTSKYPKTSGGVGWEQCDKRVAKQISTAHVDVPVFASDPTNAQWLARYGVDPKVGDHYFNSTGAADYVLTVATGTSPSMTLTWSTTVSSTNSLQQAFAAGQAISGANSSANAMQVGDGTDYVSIWSEGTNDVRIGSAAGADLTIAPADDLALAPTGGDTTVAGTIAVSYTSTGTAATVTTTNAAGTGFKVVGPSSQTAAQIVADGSTSSASWIGADSVGQVTIQSDGALAHADASLLRIASSGKAANSASGICAKILDTGTVADTGTAYAVVIDSTNNEALNVSTGKCNFAETIAVSDLLGNDASLGVAGKAGSSGAGGAIAMVGGAGDGAAAGGAITAVGGASGAGATGNGGAVTATGGAAASTNGTGGAVSMTGGAGTGTGAGGAASLVGGAGGASGTGAGGAVALTGGASSNGATGNGGAAAVTAGAAISTNGTGGAASLVGGVGTGTGAGGAVTITSGASGGASGTAGAVAIDTGSKAGGTAGALTIGGTNAETVTIGRNTMTVASIGRLTTTDGVASGTAKVVGGRMNTPAQSDALTNTDSETEFSTGDVTIPANTLKAGSVVKIRYAVRATATNGSDTLGVKCYFGANGTSADTAIITHTAADATNDDIVYGDMVLVANAAAGAAVAVTGVGHFSELAAAGGALKTCHLASANFATNAALHVSVDGKWSAASASNSCLLEFLIVEIV